MQTWIVTHGECRRLVMKKLRINEQSSVPMDTRTLSEIMMTLFPQGRPKIMYPSTEPQEITPFQHAELYVKGLKIGMLQV